MICIDSTHAAILIAYFVNLFAVVVAIGRIEKLEKRIKNEQNCNKV
jgi:hypothetical protein